MGFGVSNSQNFDFVRGDKMGEDSRLEPQTVYTSSEQNAALLSLQ